VLWNISNRDISITIEVDENVGEVDPGSQDRRYSVHGVVTGVDGRELADAEVTVWRQRIRSRVRLVTGRTSEEGSYRLSYRPPPDDVPSKLLIIVEASSEHLASPLLSPLVEAQPDLQIDLHVEPSDQSELAKLLRGITPLLDRLELTDLVENDEHQDLSFLARELGKTSEEIMRVVVAARRRRSTFPLLRSTPSFVSECRRRCRARSWKRAKTSRSSTRWYAALAR
jgi:hypothetical protein